jgi:hypothetical protein
VAFAAIAYAAFALSSSSGSGGTTCALFASIISRHRASSGDRHDPVKLHSYTRIVFLTLGNLFCFFIIKTRKTVRRHTDRFFLLQLLA